MQNSNFYIKYKKSITKNGKGILFMLFSAILVSVAQLLWKMSNGNNFKLLIVGISLYGLSSMLMVLSYRFGSLSVLHPIMSINYGVGLALSYFFLKEIVTWQKLLGIITIIVGVVLIGGSDADQIT
jgi:undecaprenyl phosphate-alpha-L-ara4N flippase subunit ArnE